MFSWDSLDFCMIQKILAIWPLVPLPFLNPAGTSGSSRFTYCWSLAWRILSVTLLAWEIIAVVQWFEHSLTLSFFGTGMKTELFQSCGHCWIFQIYWHIASSSFTASSFRIWNSLAGIPSPPLTLFVVGFLGPTWSCTPGCLAPGEWSHHRGYLCHKDFWYSSSILSCHLFLIYSASVRFILFMSFIVPIFAWNIPLVSNFLEEISSLSHSVVFLSFLCINHWERLSYLSLLFFEISPPTASSRSSVLRSRLSDI